MTKKKITRKVLKIKRVPPEIHAIPPDVPLPEPLKELVIGIQAGKVVEIHAVDPEPRWWEKFCKWWN